MEIYYSRIKNKLNFINSLYIYRTKSHKIIYTLTDEAPALATKAFIPILKKFIKDTNVTIELSDISLANRVLAVWSSILKPEQQKEDCLGKLAEYVKSPEANIIKLPNISASVSQLVSCISELQKKGYQIPDYPQTPKNEKEVEIKEIYSKVLGSSVNPVIREGNSDRRASSSVKNYAKKHPIKMGEWKSNCKTHVAHMKEGDFYQNEVSYIMQEPAEVRIEFVDTSNRMKILKDKLSLLEGFSVSLFKNNKRRIGEVIDATFMSQKKLVSFIENELQDARNKNLLISLHLKTTMMKESDPRIFGKVVQCYFQPLFEKYSDLFRTIEIDPKLGLSDLFEKLKKLPKEKKNEIEQIIQECFSRGPSVAMVSNQKTNFHVPSDVIIDASMPNVIRDSGKMMNEKTELVDTKCIIPDRCYALQYQSCIDFMKKNGQFDPSTMGHTSNVGLMALKAEEYGSHDKTFELPNNGIVRVRNIETKKVLFEHFVEKGDIWRMTQTKDIAIKDWVKLAVTRTKNENTTSIFWLDKNRAHDQNMIFLVEKYLKEHDTEGLDISIMDSYKAMQKTLERAKRGKDTISVTGNVLRDYHTDLFPILELGTSARMLSIVHLLSGGGLYETGAGGSAPKHVEQFIREGHIRWDSLGEYQAVAVCLEDMGIKFNNNQIRKLGESLNEAISLWLNHSKLPSKKVNEIDNRGSTFYLTLYWAQILAKDYSNFAQLASELAENEKTISEELLSVQGKPIDLGGYFLPDPSKLEECMRPSKLFNGFIDK